MWFRINEIPPNGYREKSLFICENTLSPSHTLYNFEAGNKCMPNKFDRIIQENLRGLTLSLVNRILNMQQAEVIRLPRKVQRTLEREMDTLLKIVSPAIGEGLLNVEWQTSNDPRMCKRMLLYHAHSALEYDLPIMGVVVYIGRDPVNMPVSIEYANLKYNYRLIDMTELNPDIFLQSDIPEEIIMAVLAGKTRHEQKREVIRKILFKLRLILKHDSQELNRRVAQFEIIGQLRNVQKIILQEELKMAVTYNIEEDIRYNQGLEKGLQELSVKIAERNEAIVKNLLMQTSHSPEQIAGFVNVPVELVLKIKDSVQ